MIGYLVPNYEQTSFDLWGLTSTSTTQPASSQEESQEENCSPPFPQIRLDPPIASRFVPSPYQQAIFDFSLSGDGGDGLVDAAPGSGKSTTLIEFARRLPSDKSVLLVAFSRHIAKELTPKLKLAGLWQRSNPHTGQRSVQAQTIHSLGYATLRQDLLAGAGRTKTTLGVDERKYDKLVAGYLKEHHLPSKHYQYPLTELVRLTQLTLTDHTDKEAMRAMVNFYNLVEALPVWETALAAVGPLLEEGQRLAREEYEINYNEMLYLPVIWGLQPERFDWVLVDEYQDLSKAQLELMLRCRAEKVGRFLFVGDHHQSIFGFNCAEPSQKQLILERTNATVLPLSICYRCPGSHVELAAQIYPKIEVAPNAKPGEIYRDLSQEDLLELVRPDDLIICRTTAPLISVCFTLIRCGIKASVRGRDIGRSLKAILTPLEKKQLGKLGNSESEPPTIDKTALYEYLEEYQQEQIRIAKLQQAAPTAISAIEDKVATLKAVYESSWPRPKTIAALKEVIGQIFSDKQASVWLSSVHRAKGLEAERVFILRPDLLPFPKATLAWEQEQEWNCLYVALTRAKSALYFVNPPTAKSPSQSEAEGNAEQSRPTPKRGLLALLEGRPIGPAPKKESTLGPSQPQKTPAPAARHVHLRLRLSGEDATDELLLEAVKELLRRYPGQDYLHLHLQWPDGESANLQPTKLSLSYSALFEREFKALTKEAGECWLESR